MAYMITDECIACFACLSACPTGAVLAGIPIFRIESSLCTECVIEFSEPQCVAVCPVDSIIRDPRIPEDYQQLIEKKNRLVSNAQS